MNTNHNPGLGRARVQRPERPQVEWRPIAWDQCLASDHRVRLVWAYVDSLDLSAVDAQIQAVEGGAGRDAVAPKILLALWMFATIEGISSARQLARLCERDLASLWICGGVGVNDHLWSDFRVGQAAFLDQLLTDTIATLRHPGLVSLELVAQDGMRVRAHAGSSSFRREKRLPRCREESREQVEKLRQESEREIDQNASHARREAARARAARERQERSEKALEELAQLQAQQAQGGKPTPEEDAKKAPRSSTTDPEARKMKRAEPPRRTSPPSNNEGARPWLRFMEKQECGNAESIPLPGSGATPTKCLPFASGWRPSRPRPSTSSRLPLRSSPMPSAGTEASPNFAYEAWRKRGPWRYGMQSTSISCGCDI